jgi:hypothetical protein
LVREEKREGTNEVGSSNVDSGHVGKVDTMGQPVFDYMHE